MENNIHQFDLSRLAAVLESALDVTTKTKIVLQKSCDVAQYMLSNWPILDATVHEEPIHCTTDGNDEDPEVAKTIEQVLKQAQKLREASTISQLKSKYPPLTKTSNIQKISSEHGLGSKKLHDKVQSKIQTAKFSSTNIPQTSGLGPSGGVKIFINKHSFAKRNSLDSCSPRPTLTNINQQSIPIPVVKGNYAKKTVTKPRLRSSPSLLTTYQKDFSVHANSNISKHSIPTSSNLKPKKSLVNDESTAILCSKNTDSPNVNMDRDPKKSNGTFPEEIGISDLEDILSRVTAYSNITADSGIKYNKIPELKVNSFLSYGDKIPDITKKDYRVVGIAEAVDVLGVPSDLVTVLKTYHFFLAENQERKKNEYHAGKKHIAAERFLMKLSTMNAGWREFAHEPLVELFSEYMALVTEVSSVVECKFKGICDETLACLQQKLELLEKKHHKWSNVDESIFTQPKTRNHNGIMEENKNHCISRDGYATIGVWNSNSTQRFKALAEMQYIRYSSEAQWKKYEANVQEIQMLELQTEVFEVVEAFILPHLLTYDVQDPTFPKIYKTVCSLCNMTLLTSPIMVKLC